MLPYILNILFSVTGFGIAFYIWNKKRQKATHLVCPMKAHCDSVVYSRFSKFFGISVEVLGMFYYGLIGLGYAVTFVFHGLVPPTMSSILLLVSALAFLFSTYLIFIQIFTLKEYCSWCIMSAILSTAIFITTAIGAAPLVNYLVTEWRDTILMFHVLAMALGLGSATLADILFFKFLKDLRISALESEILHTVSQIIWLALAGVVLTGIGLFLADPGTLLLKSKFLAKMIVVLVIIINGSILNLVISPRLLKITFGEKHHHTKGELHKARMLAFALGPISIISWYTAFFLGSLRSLPWSVSTILGGYAILLAIGIVAGQIVDRVILARMHEKQRAA